MEVEAAPSQVEAAKEALKIKAQEDKRRREEAAKKAEEVARKRQEEEERRKTAQPSGSGVKGASKGNAVRGTKILSGKRAMREGHI